MATKVLEGTLLFVAYHRVVHDATVQRMFGAAWKSKMAVGRVLGSDTKRQGACRRAERYVTCEWFVLPERRKRELAARSCLLRVDVVRKCRVADVVVHEAYMDDLHDLDMTDITVIATTAPAIPSTAPTGAADEGDPDGGSCVQPDERGEMDVDAPPEQSVAASTVAEGVSGITEEMEVDAATECAPTDGWEWGEQLHDMRDMTRPPMTWRVRGFDGVDITPGDGKARPAAHYFESVFPMGHLHTIVQHTNEVLQKEGHKVTTVHEVMQWIGVILCMSMCEFASRSDLSWKRLCDPQSWADTCHGTVLARCGDVCNSAALWTVLSALRRTEWTKGGFSSVAFSMRSMSTRRPPYILDTLCAWMRDSRDGMGLVARG